MKEKFYISVNKILNVKKITFVIWVCLWLTLLIMLISKFCFNLWYPIVVENKTFIEFCNFVEERQWLTNIVFGLLYLLNVDIFILMVTHKKRYERNVDLALVSLLAIIAFTIKCFNSVIGSILELPIFVVIPTIFNIKKKSFNNKILDTLVPICAYAIINLWQMNILLVRGLPFGLVGIPVVIQIALQLDYYVFLIITWMEVNRMGLIALGWFFGKTITELEAIKEKESQKLKPNKKLLAQVEKAIDKKKG